MEFNSGFKGLRAERTEGNPPKFFPERFVLLIAI